MTLCRSDDSRVRTAPFAIFVLVATLMSQSRLAFADPASDLLNAFDKQYKSAFQFQFPGTDVAAVGLTNGGLAFVKVNSADGTVEISLNNSVTKTILATYKFGVGASAVAVGDFNLDGKTDLAIINSNNNTVSILKGNGDGTFQLPVSYGVGSGPRAVGVGDFNGDGIDDLALANFNSNDIWILPGNGDGTFAAASK